MKTFDEFMLAVSTKALANTFTTAIQKKFPDYVVGGMLAHLFHTETLGQMVLPDLSLTDYGKWQMKFVLEIWTYYERVKASAPPGATLKELKIIIVPRAKENPTERSFSA